jgi:hypothetical protein
VSEELQTILIVLSIFVIVGAIAYFASPGRGKAAPKQPHDINLPEWAWVALALAMWAPLWWMWLTLTSGLLKALAHHNYAAFKDYWIIIFFLAVLPSFKYLYQGRFRTLAWFWLAVLSFGRARPNGPINRTPFAEPTETPPTSLETKL